MLRKSEPIIITCKIEYNGDKHNITIPNEIAKLMEMDLEDTFEVTIRKIERSNG